MFNKKAGNIAALKLEGRDAISEIFIGDILLFGPLHDENIFLPIPELLSLSPRS